MTDEKGSPRAEGGSPTGPADTLAEFQRAPWDIRLFLELQEAMAGKPPVERAELWELRGPHEPDPPRAAELWCQAAEARLAAGQLERGEEDLRRALAVDRGGRAAAIYAQRLVSVRRFAEAADVLEAETLTWGNAAPADAPARAQRHRELAALWHDHLGRVDLALEHWLAAWRLDPGDNAAIDAARSLYRSLGDDRSLIGLYEEELAQRRTSSDRVRRARLEHELGQLRARRGELTQAIAHLEQALALDPDEEKRAQLAELFSRGTGDSNVWPTGEAIGRAVALFLELAALRRQAQDPEGALVFLRRALGVHPRSAEALTALEETLVSLERWRDLEKLWASRIAGAADATHEIDVASLLRKRAELLGDRLGDREGAKAAWAELAKHEPPGGPAAQKLRLLYTVDANWAELVALAERELAAADGPGDGDVTTERRLDSRAETELVGDVTENTTLVADRRVEELLSLATIAREHLGNREQAAEYLHRILSIDPNHAEALTRYADHFRDKRDWRGLADLAEFAVEAAVQTGADTAEITRRLEELAVVAEQRQGDVERATAAWKRILTVEPGHVKAKDALRRLASRTRMWESLVTVLEKEAQGAHGPKDRAEALKRIAQVYRERQVDPRRAIALYEEALSLLADDGPTLKALADLYEREGDDAGVARVLRAQLDVEAQRLAEGGGPPSKWPTATRIERLTTLRRLAGMYEARLHDLEGVVYASTATLEMLPGDRDALDRLERVLEKANDVERLEQALIYRAEAATGPAERTRALRRLARIAEQRGDRTSAIERWESLLRSAPNSEEALAALSPLYEEAGRFAELATTLERLVVLGAQRDGKPADPRERAVDVRRWARVVDGKLNDAPRAVKAWRLLLDLLPKDREAQGALAKRHEAMGAWRDLAEIMGRQVALLAAEDRPRAVEIALRRAKLVEDRLGAADDALAVLEGLVASVDPANAAAHGELRRLHVARGDVEGAIRIAEREVYLAPSNAVRTARLIEIGALCRDHLQDARRALQAYERAAALAPGDEAVLAETAELYARVEDWERHAITLEKLAARRQGAEQQAMYLRIAHVVEERLGDPRTAFRWYHAAHNLAPGTPTLDELRHAAERGDLWAPLAEVLEEERRAQAPGSDPSTREDEVKRYVALCRELANVTERRLNDPTATLAILRDAAMVAPDDESIYAEAERIAADTAKPSAWQSVLGLYNVWLDARTDAPGRIAVHERRARVLDDRLQDATAALDELVHAFALAPQPGAVRDGILRLAGRTRRWDSAIAVEMTLFQRETAPAAKVAAASRAAQLIEEKLGERVRAFRAYLMAFRVAPEDGEVGLQLWRLARAIGAYEDEKDRTPSPESTVGVIGKPAAVTPLGLSPAAIFGGKAAAAVAKVVEASQASKNRNDSTIPLTVEDLMEARPRPRKDQTIELRLEDLILADEDGARPTPGQIARRLTRPPAAPPMPPQRRYASAWEELAAAYEALPGKDLKSLYLAAEVWERGASDLPRAFATLSRALAAAPGDPEPKERLYRLAEDHLAWDTLAELFEDAAERAERPDDVAGFQHEVAHIRVRQGRPRDAEALYRQLLGMRPDDTVARERLETIFRSEERWIDLAASLEERTDARLGPGVAVSEQERPALLLELARLYDEKLQKPYEAVGALERLQQLAPDDLDAIERTAAIYARVGRWARVVDALSRVAEHTEGTPRAREARRRVAEIYAQELELPERAIEAYEAVVALWPDDAEAYEALDKLLEQGQRWDALLEVLRRRAALAKEPAARGELYRRRGRIALARLERTDEAIASLRHARALIPDDLSVGDDLAAALARGGHAREAAKVLEELAQRGGAEGDVAAWLIRAAALYTGELDDREAARRALDRVLAKLPDHPSALAAMARLAEATDPRAFAATRLREAAAVIDEQAKVAALLDAGRALRDRLDDPEGARDAFRRVLEIEPANAEAVWAMAAMVAEGGGISEAAALLERRLEESPSDDERAKLTTELAALAQRAGVPAAAERRLEEALAVKPDYLPAIIARADLYRAEEAFAELEDFLRRTLPRLEGADVEVRAELDRRLAEAYERLGRDDEAYVVLLEADKLQRNDLLTKLALGENRYRARRWREAALHLSSLVEHAEAPTRAAEVAEGLVHAAHAEVRSLRPERAPALYEAALKLKADHTAALHALADVEMQRGNVARAAELLEREAAATGDPAERLRLYEALGDLHLVAFSDRDRARRCFSAAVDAAAPLESRHLPLLAKLHAEQLALGDRAGAGRIGELMASFSADPRARAQTLLEAARAYQGAGDLPRARQAALRAVDADPSDEDALLLMSDVEQDHEAIASRLGRALGSLKEGDHGPDPARRAELWRRLGDARRGRGDLRNALIAYERAVGTADPGTPGVLGARRAIAELQGESPDAQLAQLEALVAVDPRPDEARKLARLLVWKGSDRISEARQVHRLATALGAPLADEDQAFLAGAPRRVLAPDEVYPGTLDETLLLALTADADDAPWHDVLVEASQSIPLLWPDAGEILERLGLGAAEKLPSRDDSPAIAIHQQVAKVLGAPATVLYAHPEAVVRVVCAMPPLVVLGPTAREGTNHAHLRFLLGRAALAVRPGRLLALGLDPNTFGLLCAGLARAFAAVLVPGFAVEDVEVEAERLRRTLPVKSRSKIEGLLRGQTAETLGPDRYRAASERAADRAGLLASAELAATGLSDHLAKLAASPAFRAAVKQLGL
jgi:tetratricopeptide (TPR) repeat protein